MWVRIYCSQISEPDCGMNRKSTRADDDSPGFIQMLFLVLEFSLQALYFNLQLDVLKSTGIVITNCHRPSILEPGSQLRPALVHSHHLTSAHFMALDLNVGLDRSVTRSTMNEPYGFRISPELLTHPANLVITALGDGHCPSLATR